VEPARSGAEKAGNLYIVATPVGNLEDLTLRALRILRQVSWIACEDTRQTLKLLNKYRLKKKLISYYKPREKEKIPRILRILSGGKDVALVSDAGTPGLSDPGYLLIREAISQGIRVIPIPGASAISAALSAGGLPTHRFLFLGFAPSKKIALEKMLSKLKDEEGTLVFFVPARKIIFFLDIVLKILGNRQIVLAREMTKIHEEFIRDSAEEMKHKLEGKSLRGEATLLIEGV